MKQHRESRPWAEIILIFYALTAASVLVHQLLHRSSSLEPVTGGKPLAYWVEQLDSPNTRSAQAAIERVGLAAVPYLLHQPAREKPMAVSAICHALAVLGPEVIPLLVKASDDPSCEVRVLATRALATLPRRFILHNDVALSVFIQRANDPAPDVDDWAVEGLARVEGSTVVVAAALMKVLGRENEDERTQVLRLKAAYFLGRLGPAASNSIPSLRNSLKSSDPVVRHHSAVALWRITRDANTILPTIMDHLQNGPLAERQQAALTLGRIGAETALPECVIRQVAALNPSAAAEMIRPCDEPEPP